jgi:hypothetical protein
LASTHETELARVVRERDEALEQQAATAEILHAISSSPGNLQTVFEAILENATRICEAKFGNLWLREGDKFRIVAVHGGSPEYRENLFAEPLIVPDARSAMSRIATDREVVQIDDISKEPSYGMRMRIATIKIAKARTLVGVPMLKDNEVVGHHRHLPPGSAALHRQADRVAHELRQPSRHSASTVTRSASWRKLIRRRN